MSEFQDNPQNERFGDALDGTELRMELDRAALILARIEVPELVAGPYLGMLDEHASNIAARVSDLSDGREFVLSANRYLFDENGFRGNTADYYDARNSCLNEVLDRRLGIPITLSVLYMEIARRLAMPVYGIGMPGHFLIEYSDAGYSTYIDPFDGGKFLTAEDCYQLIETRFGTKFERDGNVLRRMPKKQIVIRMLRNLLGVYVRNHALPRALEVLDLLVSAQPDSAEEYKQRGIVQMQLKKMRAAKADLEQYLLRAGDAPDVAGVKEQLEAIHRWLARLN